MENGEWGMENGEWGMENGEWRMEMCTEMRKGSLESFNCTRVLGVLKAERAIARARSRCSRAALTTPAFERGEQGTRKEFLDLHIYPVILSFVEEVAPIIGRISRSDPDLARQLRRSSASVVLNVADGMYARGRSRTHSYNVALREMRESYAALEVSVRLRYIAPLSPELERRVAHILGTLVRLSFPRQRAG